MIHLVLKVTEKCNARCSYCKLARTSRAPTMSQDLVDRLCLRADEWLRDHPGEDMEFLWHGGEPLLMGVPFFSRLEEFLKRTMPETSPRLKHGIQTNLTCFSARFAEVFRRLGIRSVGTSFNPEPGLRGLGSAVDSEGYNRKFMAGLAALEEAGLDWGVNCVVTRSTLPRALDVFHFLTNLKLGGGISFNPVFFEDASPDTAVLKADEFGSFLETLFPVWRKRRVRYPNIEPFESMAAGRVSPQDQAAAEGPASREAEAFILISPAGAARPARTLTEHERGDYGSVLDRPLGEIVSDILADDRRETLRRSQSARCRDCRLWTACRGGMSRDAFSQNMKSEADQDWCAARLAFMDKCIDSLRAAEAEIRS